MRSVYMMKTSHDLYKIGIAKNVDNRLKSHQTSNGSKVLLVTYARCGNALQLEAQVHALLKDYRQPGGREWFELTPKQAIKVCIYIHQEAEYFYSENDIQQLLSEYAVHHESIVSAKKSLEDLTEQVGSGIQKAIGQLRKYKPLPKPIKLNTPPKSNNDKQLFKQATEIIRVENKASTSLLQRKLKIGYGRAARLIEEMEKQGIIGKADGSRPRPLLTSEGIPIAKAMVDDMMIA